MELAQEMPPRQSQRTVRLGVVSFLNTLPLIDGLEGVVDLELRQSVPSLLCDALCSGEVDVALCSTIDYQRTSESLVILPVSALGCDGPTLTVRLYSQTPLDQVTRIHCDTDSHTSIALMQILMKELHGIEPELVDFDAREHVAEHRLIENPEAALLIGDKVVTESPPAVRYPHQMDLGAAWKGLTGRPFVFAAWMARADGDPASLRLASMALDRQRRHNLQRLDDIIERGSRAMHWPRDLASEYLKNRITYRLDDEHLAALELFFEKAREHGLIANRKPVELMKV